MVFSDERKKKNYISWRDIMRDSWEQNFRTKDGRQQALTGCSRRSETRAQWTDVRAATDREVPARMKTLTRWTICFWVKRTSPNSQHSPWIYHWRQAFLSHLLSTLYERICSWNALRGDVRKSWLRRTALLVSYFWRSFFQFAADFIFLQMKRCSLWLQQWMNCDYHLN